MPPYSTSRIVAGGGIEGECMITPKLGIPLALMFLSQDSHVMYDTVDVWLMDSADLDWMAFTVGANYHLLETDNNFDLFVGQLELPALLDQFQQCVSGQLDGEGRLRLPALGNRQGSCQHLTECTAL